MKIEGILAIANKENLNGRTYSPEVLSDMVKQFEGKKPMFGELLNDNNIEFEKSFYVYFDDIKYKIYDLYLPEYNLLIEADGDYWHGHPKLYKTLNETQVINVENDKFKNKLAKENGYNLVRFWG